MLYDNDTVRIVRRRGVIEEVRKPNIVCEYKPVDGSCWYRRPVYVNTVLQENH